MKKIAFALVSLVASVSFANGQDLNVGLRSSDVYLIPTSTQSCYARAQGRVDDDIQARYFQILPTLNWVDTAADFYLSAVSVKLSSPVLGGQPITLVLGGAELASIDGSLARWSGVLQRAPNAQNPTTFQASCALTFGNISIPDANDVGTVTMSGEVTFIGKRVESSGAETPMFITKPITVTNIGTH